MEHKVDPKPQQRCRISPNKTLVSRNRLQKILPTHAPKEQIWLQYPGASNHRLQPPELPQCKNWQIRKHKQKVHHLQKICTEWWGYDNPPLVHWMRGTGASQTEELWNSWTSNKSVTNKPGNTLPHWSKWYHTLATQGIQTLKILLIQLTLTNN